MFFLQYILLSILRPPRMNMWGMCNNLILSYARRIATAASTSLQTEFFGGAVLTDTESCVEDDIPVTSLSTTYSGACVTLISASLGPACRTLVMTFRLFPRKCLPSTTDVCLLGCWPPPYLRSTAVFAASNDLDLCNLLILFRPEEVTMSLLRFCLSLSRPTLIDWNLSRLPRSLPVSTRFCNYSYCSHHLLVYCQTISETGWYCITNCSCCCGCNCYGYWYWWWYCCCCCFCNMSFITFWQAYPKTFRIWSWELINSLTWAPFMYLSCKCIACLASS